MGKLIVKLGLWIQHVWKKLMCKWNWLISKLIVDVKDCPVAQCVCKKQDQEITGVPYPKDPVTKKGKS